MLARVQADCEWRVVTAFSGNEYVKGEWRFVPTGLEQQAQKHPYLETQDEPESQPAVAVDYSALGVLELRKLAKDAGIANPTTMKKADLITALENKDGND